ncbi:hypothetical protein Ciccas_007472 [Cichlidogyrus casuarinus]|uniref:Disintegrin domain-containing protein n=1 Tax=Cichlidogyrus casuarinus TaxID=1844966 RepID=A0ABD2Q2S9_9PLAT
MPKLLQYGMGVCLKDSPARSYLATIQWPQPQTPNTAKPSDITGSHRIASQISNDTVFSQVPTVANIYRPDLQRPALVPAFPHAEHYPGGAGRGDKLCGNGQLDPGEECDCGTRTSCPPEQAACCDVDYCRLRPGAECAMGACCEITRLPGQTPGPRGEMLPNAQCLLRKSGSVCREPAGDCDLPEFCNGKSEWCPADVYKVDGTSCYTQPDHDGFGGGYSSVKRLTIASQGERISAQAY